MGYIFGVGGLQELCGWVTGVIQMSYRLYSEQSNYFCTHMGGLQEDSDKLQESQRQFAGQAMYMGMYILLFCKSTSN